MALVVCQDCGVKHSDSAVACPSCGARPKKSKLYLIIAVSVILGFIGIGASLRIDTPLLDARTPTASSPDTGRSAEMQRLVDHAKADQCWEDASHAPNSQQAARQFECRAIEHEYTLKYNRAF